MPARKILMLAYLLTKFETKVLIECHISPLICNSFRLMSILVFHCHVFSVSTQRNPSWLILSQAERLLIVLLSNLTTPKTAVSVAAQHCSRNRDNAALTINNSLSKTTMILWCVCILQFQTHHEETDGLIRVSRLLLEATFILSSDWAGSRFPWGRDIAGDASLDLISWHNIHRHSPVTLPPITALNYNHTLLISGLSHLQLWKPFTMAGHHPKKLNQCLDVAF